MKFVSLRDLKINPSGVVDRLAREDLVVTRRGKPAAALVYLDEDLLDDYILLHHPTLLKETEAAREEYRKKGGLDHASMRKAILGRRG
jgi:prevent-host-death family protein